MPLVTTTVDYRDGDTLLEGFFAYDSDAARPVPAVMIAHMWGGRVEFVCEKARQLAAQGYAAFALDMYGKGVFGSNPAENEKLMQPFIDDRALLKRRMGAALHTVRALMPVDPARIAAIGYCFGGLCVLDLVRSGADIKAAVSIHGLLDPPATQPQATSAKILILHGSDDPLADTHSLLALQQELTHINADWQTIVYGGTQHAFTNPAANNSDLGTVYHPLSSQRSWRALLDFLREVFV
jgi:dienelactone hydrolase